MANVHDFLKTWQGSQNLRATQKEFRAQNKQMTAVGYISDTEEIIKALVSLFQHDGAAAFKLLDRSPLPPPLSAKDLAAGRTPIFNVRRLQRINRHPVESDEDSASERILDTEDWRYSNGDLDNPNDSEDNCAVDIESDIEQDNSVEDPESREQLHVSPALNVPRLIRPPWKSKIQAEKVLMTVNTIKTRRNKGVKKK